MNQTQTGVVFDSLNQGLHKALQNCFVPYVSIKGYDVRHMSMIGLSTFTTDVLDNYDSFSQHLDEYDIPYDEETYDISPDHDEFCEMISKEVRDIPVRYPNTITIMVTFVYSEKMSEDIYCWYNKQLAIDTIQT